MFRLIMVMLAAIHCSSCVLTRSARSRVKRAETPASFSMAGGEVKQNTRWWTEFKSGELDALLDKTLAGNLTVAKAAARLKQAQYLARRKGAALKPDLSAEGSASVSEREKAVVESGDKRSEFASLHLAASYELDIWGRVAAQSREAVLSAEASAEDFYAIQISVVSETAVRYFELMNVRRKLDLLKQQIETRKKIAELIELRYRRSNASALDVLQQREAVASVESLDPPLKAREKQLLNEISILTGTMPGRNLKVNGRNLPSMPPMPAAGLPADVINARPDVVSSFLKLKSSYEGLKVARADRYPALRISAQGGYSSSDFSNLFDNWVSTLAGNIMGPIIDGGRRRSEVKRTKAVVDERLAEYRATVLNAVVEVENAMNQEFQQKRYLAALKRQHEAAQKSFKEASNRYMKGTDAYLPALIALASVQTLERKIRDAEYQLVVYRVNLYRALGGTWMKEAKKSHEK